MVVPAFLPAPIVRTFKPRRVGGGGAGGRVGGSLGDRLAPPRPPGKGGPYNPILPPTVPFQPGASPAPLLGPWAMLGLGAAVLGKLLLDLLNGKGPDPGPGEWSGQPSTEVMFPAPTAVRVTSTWAGSGSIKLCPDDGRTFPVSAGPGGGTVVSGLISGVRVSGTQTRTSYGGCPDGPRIQGAYGQVDFLDGSGAVVGGMGPLFSGTIAPGNQGSVSLTIDVTVTDFFTGETYEPPGGEREPLPDAVRPTVPAPAPWPGPLPLTVPVPGPLPDPLPLPVPDPIPVPAPATVPGGLPAPAPAPAPAPGPGPAPAPGPAVVPAVPVPLPVPAVGPLPAPAPLPVPVTDPGAVIIGGVPVGGGGWAPAPNLTAMAAELGRLEAKAELGLNRPENGGGGPLPDDSILAVLEGLIRQILNELLNDVPGGSFYLLPPCPPPGGGDPLPAVEVEYNGGSNPTAALSAKLDGLAQLLQVHKDMGQPSCKTVIYGEEVTVQFEEL